jgi:hypothetical protein
MTRTMLALLVLCVPALARDNGQYTSVAPEVRQWFRLAMIVPPRAGTVFGQNRSCR